MSRPDGVRRHDVINDGVRFGFSQATIDRVKDSLLITKDGGLWKLLDDKAF